MKRILFVAFLALSLMVFLTSPAWASGLDDVVAGNSAFQGGNYDEAIRFYTKAIASGELVQHILGQAYNNRGSAWGKKGDYDKAIADYTKAIELNPKDPNAYNNLAWLLATCPIDRYRDGKKAVAQAERLVNLEGTAGTLDTLAAAYAEAGRFPEAIKTQEKAITKLKQEGGAKDLPEFERHLSSYKAGKPWREK